MSSTFRLNFKDLKNKSKRKAVKPKASDSKKEIVKIVKNTLEKVAEKKIAIYQNVASVSGVPTASSVFPVTPYGGYMSISQGSGQGDRIGNRIRVHKATLRYVLFPLPFDGTTNNQPQPKDVKIWFFKWRESQTLLATNPPDFIQTGNSETTLSGFLIDLNRVINKDMYISHGHKTHKVGTALYNSTGVATTVQNYTNNDYKLNTIRVMDVTSMFPKTIIYNDVTNNPESNLVQFAVQAVNADGSIVDPNNRTVSMQFQITLEYTDL